MPVIENSQIRVEIAEAGAELRSIRTAANGAEWLWQGDAAWWAGRAPLLFPVVGQSPKGAVTIAGQPYPMGSHGFARHAQFKVVGQGADHVTLALTPTPESEAAYPFAFRLQAQITLDGAALVYSVRVENHDTRPMPFQFGFHPAFCHPLPGAEGAAHDIRFAAGLPDHMLRLGPDHLMDPAPHPVPGADGVIAMDTRLFAAGAMVFPNAATGAVSYGAGDTRVVMTTQNLPDFALWQKEGAPFLCLEPWQGMAPFPAQGPALENRSNAITLAPGAVRDFTMRLAFTRG